jgi:putative ABC transport system substrate-binding protein
MAASALWWALPARAQVLLVSSETGGAYDEAAEAFRAELSRIAPRISVTGTTIKDLAPFGNTQLVVTLGNQAARGIAALGQHPPAIYSLLSRAGYEAIPGLREGHNTAILLDQPAARQIELVRLALPGFQRLALIEGNDSREAVAQLADAARDRNFTVARERVTDAQALFPALQQVTAAPAVLLATPDSGVFNSFNIQNILLTAYRQHSPVVGFSSAYVRAGAVLALYSTPAQIGRQTAEAAHAMLAGGSLPAPQGPRYFEVGTNPQVARSLGIDLAEPDVLRARLARLEGLAP